MQSFIGLFEYITNSTHYAEISLGKGWIFRGESIIIMNLGKRGCDMDCAMAPRCLGNRMERSRGYDRFPFELFMDTLR